jgi:predicted phosphoribosyltransferase
LREKYKLYRGDREHVAVKNKNIILVDDGIATGNTPFSESRNATSNNLQKNCCRSSFTYDTLAVFEKNTDEFVYLIASKTSEA